MGQRTPKPAGGNACIRMERLKERITLLVKKPKTAVCTAALVLLIAGISVACTFTGAPKTYTVTQEWYDAGFSEEDAQACLAFLDWVEDFDVDDANAASWLAESGAADFKALDGKPTEMAAAFAQAVKSIRAEELSPPTDSSNKVTYTLSITDRRKGFGFSLSENWRVALIASAEYEADDEPFTYGKPVAMIDNAALTNFLYKLFRLTEKTTPVYASMEDYALAQIKAIRENGISYYVRDKDGFVDRFSDTVEDVRVIELSCIGKLDGFAPDGMLQLWAFSTEAKPTNKAGAAIELFNHQRLSDDGYYSDCTATYIVMLHKDDGYYLLKSFSSTDDFFLLSHETYLHDVYCDVMGLDDPRYLREGYFTYTDDNGNSLIADGVLTTGDGWYFYLPSGDAWIRGGIHDLWYSAYSTESTITVNAFDATVEETAASLISDGWTKETSGALTVYRRCCPALPQSLIPSFDAYESVYLYERPEGGHYEVLTVWYDLADEVNEWGWSPKAQVAAERQQLETMVRSFTVVPASKTGVSVSSSYDEQAAQYITAVGLY